MKIIKTFESFEFDNKWLQLESILLSIDGESVIKPKQEEDIDKLLSIGKVRYYDDIDLVEMDVSQCHRNSATIYNDNNQKDSKMWIVTGYALCDGVWVQHTWIEHQTDSLCIIETTEIRDEYFGFSLNKKEAQDFIYDNY